MNLIFVGVVVFLVWLSISFGIWHTHRLEYENDEVLGASLILGIGVIGVGIVGQLVGAVVWGVVVGMIVSWIIIHKKYEMNFWDIGDLTGKWVVMGLGIISLLNRDIPKVLVFIIVWGICWFVAKYYRSFSWYRSGRSGLAIVAMVSALALGEIGVAFVAHSRLYFVGILPLVFAGFLYYIRVNNFKVVQWIKIKKRIFQNGQ